MPSAQCCIQAEKCVSCANCLSKSDRAKEALSIVRREEQNNAIAAGRAAADHQQNAILPGNNDAAEKKCVHATCCWCHRGTHRRPSRLAAQLVKEMRQILVLLLTSRDKTKV